MRRHITLLAALALAVSMGCAKGAPHKMGAAGPPPGRIIPVGYDPSVSGLSGAVGEVVYVSGGIAAWVRTGVNNTDWQAFPGSGASTVSTDSTLVGNGSLGTPLGVSATAARGPASPGWFATYFQQQTGLDPRRIQCFWDDFESSVYGLAQHGVQTATGTAAFLNNVSGGIIKFTAPTSGTIGGYADWSPGAQNIIGNLQTKRWMTFARVSIASAPATWSRISLGVNSGSTFAGIGFFGTDTTWHYVRGAPPADIFDFGNTMDTSGNVFKWVYVANLDLVHVVGSSDVETTLQTTIENVSNLPNSAGVPYNFNEATNGQAAPSQAYSADVTGFCIERQ